MTWDRTTELNETCKRCGEAVILVQRENFPTHDDPGECEIESYTCDCGAEVEHDGEGAGIKEVLEDAGGFLDENGYLYEPIDSKMVYVTKKKFIEEYYDYGNGLGEIKYFIKTKRPSKFECFRLWDGTLIEQGE